VIGALIKKRERPACPVTTPAAKDPEWIPIVAAPRWLIVSRDRHMVAPGTIRTAARDLRLTRNPAVLDDLVMWYPLGRVGTVDDIAAAVAFSRFARSVVDR
jgi:hypothetical protein